MIQCSIDDCGDAVRSRGWCSKHYLRWLRNGDPLAVKRLSADGYSIDGFKAMTVPDGECWRWTGYLNAGTGYARYGSKNVHRVVYVLARGPVPRGLVIDHLCRNRWCINPDHMEAVTNWENTLRGEGPIAMNARRTHCAQGHPFDEKNTWTNSIGHRKCRQCNRDNQARRRNRLIKDGEST